MIDIGRALQHPFQDQNWLAKLGIGALVNAVPILNFAGYGYMLEHLRNTERGADVPMPEWGDNFGDKFVEGLKYFVVLFIYSLPIVLLGCVLTVVAGGLAAIADSATGRNSDAIGGGIAVISLAISCLIFLYGLALAYIYPAVTIQYAQTRDIGACLRFGDVFAIARRNTSDYVLIFLVLLLAAFAISTVTGVLGATVIGLCLAVPIWIVAAPYMNVLAGQLCGQYARGMSSMTMSPISPITPMSPLAAETNVTPPSQPASSGDLPQ